MSRIKSTLKRHARIARECAHKALEKPQVASIGIGGKGVLSSTRLKAGKKKISGKTFT